MSVMYGCHMDGDMDALKKEQRPVRYDAYIAKESFFSLPSVKDQDPNVMVQKGGRFFWTALRFRKCSGCRGVSSLCLCFFPTEAGRRSPYRRFVRFLRGLQQAEMDRAGVFCSATRLVGI